MKCFGSTKKRLRADNDLGVALDHEPARTLVYFGLQAKKGCTLQCMRRKFPDFARSFGRPDSVESVLSECCTPAFRSRRSLHQSTGTLLGLESGEPAGQRRRVTRRCRRLKSATSAGRCWLIPRPDGPRSSAGRQQIGPQMPCNLR